MAENENGQERSERATGKRLQDARKKGQIARSRELNTTTMLIAGSVMLLMNGDHIATSLADMARDSFTPDRAKIFEKDVVTAVLSESFYQGLMAIMPFLSLMVVVAIGSSISLGGFSFSTQALKPKLEKLNPIKGIKRIFSWRGLMELGKALIKFVLVGSIAVVLLQSMSHEFLMLGFESINSALLHSGHLIAWAFLGFSLSLILVTFIDVPFQLWDHARQLKMTKQEVKDEHKESEGKPEVKGRIRNLQREVAMRRMMAAVPEADVVITNPTHFAVALAYSSDEMSAPRVVAKGADLVAAQIRNIAIESDVSIVQAPTLARAIYFSTELEAEIPDGLYLAVAQVLAYVYQLRTAREKGEVEPTLPESLPVPDEYYRDSDGRRR